MNSYLKQRIKRNMEFRARLTANIPASCHVEMHINSMWCSKLDLEFSLPWTESMSPETIISYLKDIEFKPRSNQAGYEDSLDKYTQLLSEEIARVEGQELQQHYVLDLEEFTIELELLNPTECYLKHMFDPKDYVFETAKHESSFKHPSKVTVTLMLDGDYVFDTASNIKHSVFFIDEEFYNPHFTQCYILNKLLFEQNLDIVNTKESNDPDLGVEETYANLKKCIERFSSNDCANIPSRFFSRYGNISLLIQTK